MNIVIIILLIWLIVFLHLVWLDIKPWDLIRGRGTGIVVSVSFTAFGLALTQRLYKKYHSLNIDEIMMQARKSED